MLDPGEFFTSLGSIASVEAVSVANIDNPTELNAIAGTVVGERRVAYQVVAGDNSYTIYHWDSADSGGVSAPYVMADSGTGFWIAVAGRNVNPAVQMRGSLTSLSTISGTQLISTIATGTAPLSIASTTVVPNLNVSQLLGATWAAPGTIGSGTPNTGAFTTLSATGTSTLAAVNASGNIACTSNTISLTRSTAGGTFFTARNDDTTSATVINQREGGPIVVGINDTEVSRWTTTQFTIAQSTASSSTSTGALTVAGGLGVAGNITFSGATGASLRLTTATANAAVATTLGSVGPTGSTAGNPQGWLRISVAGTDRFIPFW